MSEWLNVEAGTLFPESDDNSPRLLQDYVEQEWRERGFMEPGHLAQGWRLDRALYELTLPSTGWFIDAQHADTISTVRRELGPWLSTLLSDDTGDFTMSHMTGENRHVTTGIARWMRSQKLDDDSYPHGIRFASKHGANWQCWAIWLRKVDAGFEPSEEPTQANDGCEIKAPGHNNPLKEVADLFGLTIF